MARNWSAAELDLLTRIDTLESQGEWKSALVKLNKHVEEYGRPGERVRRANALLKVAEQERQQSRKQVKLKAALTDVNSVIASYPKGYEGVVGTVPMFYCFSLGRLHLLILCSCRGTVGGKSRYFDGHGQIQGGHPSAS